MRRLPRLATASFGLGLGLLLGLLGVTLSASGSGQTLEQTLGLAWLFTQRGPRPPPDDVVIVAMSTRAEVIARFSDSHRLRDWRRAHHAELIDRLVAHDVAAIVFDITFEDARADDAVLAQAIARSRRTLLFQRAERSRNGPFIIDRLRDPSASLAQSAAGLAPFPLPRPRTHRVDQFWAFFDRVNDTPTLPVAALTLTALRQLDYPRLRQLLRDGGVREPLPERVTSAAELHTFMAALRRALYPPKPLTTIGGLDMTEHDWLQALIRVYTGPTHPLLNVYGPPNTFPIVSYDAFWDSVPGAIPKLRDKTVFVGALAAAQDNFATVFTAADGLQINGLEILATAYANLRHGHTLRLPSGPLRLALLFGFSIVCALAASLLPSLLGTLTVALIAGGYYALAQLGFNQQALWLPLFVPLLVLAPLALLGGLLWRNRWLQQVGQRLKRRLSLHVPAWVANQPIDSAPRPASPELVFGTCVVSDVAGYTGLAERVEPEHLAILTNDYYDRLIERIKHYQGEMLVIVGDGMTSLWPAQQPDRKSRLRACLAGLDMVAAVDAFNACHPDSPFPTRIGLNAGWLAMGDLGGSGRFSFGLAGDVVNTASRIEGLNKVLGTRLLAAESTVTGLDELLLRRVGRFQLKGKDEALQVFEILARRADATPNLRQLSAEFSTALALFDAGRWHDAASAFTALFNSFPDDGPTRFYVTRCRQYSHMPSPTNGAPIRLDQK